MTATPDDLPAGIALLTEADEAEMLAFELENREFFARTVGDRGDEYFAAFPAAAERGVTRITAATTTDNAASQRVLAANGFEPLPDGEPSHLELGASGRSLPAVHFVRTLG